MNSADFDREKALDQQIALLTLKEQHLQELIAFARNIKETGEITMDFKAFDNEKLETYKKKAKEQWGDTKAYAEFEEKDKNRSKEEQNMITGGLMKQFVKFGQMMTESPESQKVQSQVKQLQDYISEHFYQCTNEILAGLGQMYGAEGEFKTNIDHAGGEGCAEFCSKAIAIYCEA